MADKPRLTLALNCYKVERFVAEAVEGAFAQTYRPLEIVISDDHSPDATWARIVEVVIRLGRSETTGDVWQKPAFCGTVEFDVSPELHLALNRNERNLGLALHQNRIFELAHGEWIAFQAGDDISMPNRMARIADVVARNPKIRCLHCRTQVVDENDNSVIVPEKFLRQQRIVGRRNLLPCILGAGAVYHRDVYWKFGPLGSHVANEDHVLPLRAELLGDIYFTEERLVRYRKHGGNQSGVYNPSPASLLKYRLNMMYMYYQELMDLHHAEVERFVDLSELGCFRRLVHDKLYQFDFLTKWQLHSNRRLLLLMKLFLSPRQVFLFAKKVVKSFIERS